MLETVNNKTNKNEYYKQSPKDNYIKIRIKRKNIEYSQNFRTEQSRNTKKFIKSKHKYENSDNFPMGKINLLLSDQKRNHTIRILDNNLYKSSNNINNSNDKSLNNGHSSSKDKKQRFCTNQRGTPFLRKYMLKIHKDESITKERNKDNQISLKYFFSNNNSLSKDNNKEFYDY
jgi:hypothetical protein